MVHLAGSHRTALPGYARDVALLAYGGYSATAEPKSLCGRWTRVSFRTGPGLAVSAVPSAEPRQHRLRGIGRLHGGKRHRGIDRVLAAGPERGVAEHAGQSTRDDVGLAQVGFGERRDDRLVVAKGGEIGGAHQAAEDACSIAAGALVGAVE